MSKVISVGESEKITIDDLGQFPKLKFLESLAIADKLNFSRVQEEEYKGIELGGAIKNKQEALEHLNKEASSTSELGLKYLKTLCNVVAKEPTFQMDLESYPFLGAEVSSTSAPPYYREEFYQWRPTCNLTICPNAGRDNDLKFRGKAIKQRDYAPLVYLSHELAHAVDDIQNINSGVQPQAMIENLKNSQPELEMQDLNNIIINASWEVDKYGILKASYWGTVKKEDYNKILQDPTHPYWGEFLGFNSGTLFDCIKDTNNEQQGIETYKKRIKEARETQEAKLPKKNADIIQSTARDIVQAASGRFINFIVSNEKDLEFLKEVLDPERSFLYTGQVKLSPNLKPENIHSHYDIQDIQEHLYKDAFVASNMTDLKTTLTKLSAKLKEDKKEQLLILKVDAVNKDFSNKNTAYWVGFKVDPANSRIYYVDPLGGKINPEVCSTVIAGVNEVLGEDIQLVSLYSKTFRPQQANYAISHHGENVEINEETALSSNKEGETVLLRGNDYDSGPFLIKTLNALGTDIGWLQLHNTVEHIKSSPNPIAASKNFGQKLREQYPRISRVNQGQSFSENDQVLSDHKKQANALSQPSIKLSNSHEIQESQDPKVIDKVEVRAEVDMMRERFTRSQSLTTNTPRKLEERRRLRSASTGKNTKGSYIGY